MLYIFLILAAAIAIIAFYKLSKGSPKKEEATEAALTIQNVRPGGAIQLEGVGQNLEDFDLIITARHTYDEDGYRWHELEGEKGAEKVWIDIEEDDELELSICLRKLKLSDLAVSGRDLDQMEDDDDGEIQFEGQKFFYEESGDATFYRNSDRSQRGESFHYFDFETKDGTQYLSIERWSPKEYAVHLSEPLRPGQIKVFSLS